MILKRRAMKVFFVLAGLVVVGHMSTIQAETPPSPGSDCAVEESTYNYVSDMEGSPWELSDLYALPMDASDPTNWDFSEQFHGRFLAELGSGTSPQQYAHACASVWQDFFTHNAIVVAKVSRNITGTVETLQCISGNWVTVSTQVLAFIDASDWLGTQTSWFDISDPDSEALIQSNLEALLQTLNSQPGP